MPRIIAQNATQHAYKGWLRCNVEVPSNWLEVSTGQELLLADPVLIDHGWKVVAAHRAGSDLLAVDVWCDLAPFTTQKIELSQVGYERHQIQPIPANALEVFGEPMIKNATMQFVGGVQDGAAWRFEFMLRPPSTTAAGMFCFRAWTYWYPEQTGWMTGELLVACSNPARPDLTATLPTAVEFHFSKESVWKVPGMPVGAPVLAEGESFGDGQARAWPFVVVWPTMLKMPFDAVVAQSEFGVAAHGIEKLYSTGSSTCRNAIQRFQQNLESCQQNLHTWLPSVLGVAANSGTTGAQEDQVFVGAEALDMPVGIKPRYYAALGQLRRPCHHLEEDGSQLDIARHPRLLCWDGRPLWAGQDQLGKPRGLQMAESHGWWGPDVEHFLLNSVYSSAILTSSDALQWLLRAHATIYFAQYTTEAGLSTSQPYASRSVGWECLAVLNLYRALADRNLAERVLQHAVTRMTTVILPQHEGKTIWDVRVDDGRLGPGPRWIPWQQAVEAGGLELLGSFFERMPKQAALGTRMRKLAVAGSKDVYWHGWRQNPSGRWETRASGVSTIDNTGGSWDESFNFFGMSMAIATILRNDPTDYSCRQIWAQLLHDQPDNAWLMPGVPA